MKANANQRSIMFTPRDYALLEAVTCKVKMLSLPQVLRTWWLGRCERDMRRRLQSLAQAALIERTNVLVCGELDLRQALLTWEPGWLTPDFAVALAVSRSRWSRPLRMVPAIMATRRSADLMGGKARRVRPSEATHDLHLAQLYLKRLAEAPAAADAWIGEASVVAAVYCNDVAIPDALIRRDDSSRAIEVVGSSYTQAKLQSFHGYCKVQNWSYELW